MSKRGKDLFYLLEQREQDVRPEAPAARTRRAPTASSGSVAATVRQWFGSGRPPRKRAVATEPASTAPFGLILAAVALVALGTGYGLGRFLPRGAVAPDLAARGEGALPRRPGPLLPDVTSREAAPAPGELSADKEDEILSQLWFPLLQFDASQRVSAAQAATFLRAHGVDTARIRKFQTRDRKSDVWVIVAYATSREAAPELLAKLRAVPATRTWPNLATDIAKLTAKDNLMRPEPGK